MKRLFLFIFSFLLLFSLGSNQALAADFRSGETVTIPEGTPNLNDLYLFGGSIRVDAPVTNDVVAGGGDVTINKPVSGSIIVGGGDINLNGSIGNTLRAAGGNIEVNSSIARDLVISGGSIIITKNASVGGDILFGGGELNLEGPVRGNVHIGGGEVTINSVINGDVNAQVGKLTLGPNARINGNLNYGAEQKAQIADGAVVTGQTNFKQRDHNQERQDEAAAKAFITGGTIYKLVADILVSIFFIFFFTRGITSVLNRMTTDAVQSGAIGFGFIFFFPILALISFILLWLGVLSFLFYATVLAFGFILVSIFLGWFIMRWLEKRNNKQYALDWKASIIGPIVLFVIAAIPFIGWLAAAILMIVATGALIYEFIMHIKNHEMVPQKAVAKRK